MVFGEAESRLGLKGRIPRALLVVHSGNTTIYLVGLRAAKISRSSISALAGGEACGWKKLAKTAWRSDIRRTCRELGYEAVKIGSNMAAR